MSEATDKLTAALAKLASDGATRKNLHAAHDAADVTFGLSLGAAKEAAQGVLKEIDAIAADSEKPADAASSFPTPPVTPPVA